MNRTGAYDLSGDCGDVRCTGGVTMCAGCNGFGVLTMGGRKYRMRGGGRNIGATAQPHQKCGGTGLAVCGCTVLDEATLTMLVEVSES